MSNPPYPYAPENGPSAGAVLNESPKRISDSPYEGSASEKKYFWEGLNFKEIIFLRAPASNKEFKD